MEHKDYNRPLYKVGIQIAVVTLLVAVATAYIERNPEHLRTIFRAGTQEKDVRVELYPKETHASVDAEVKLTPMVIATAKKPGFLSVAIRFDPKTLQLISMDETKRTEQLENILPTDISIANETGIVQLTYGVTSAETLPGDSIQLTSLTFKKLTDTKTDVTIDTSKSQIVFMDETEAEIQTESATIGADSSETEQIPDPSPLPTEESSTPTGVEATATPAEPSPTPAIPTTPEQTPTP